MVSFDHVLGSGGLPTGGYRVRSNKTLNGIVNKQSTNSIDSLHPAADVNYNHSYVLVHCLASLKHPLEVLLCYGSDGVKKPVIETKISTQKY